MKKLLFGLFVTALAINFTLAQEKAPTIEKKSKPVAAKVKAKKEECKECKEKGKECKDCKEKKEGEECKECKEKKEKK